MEYKAIFFDRDGTLSKRNKLMYKIRDKYIGQIIQDNNFSLSPELWSSAWREAEKLIPEVDTLKKEEEFWIAWYKQILSEVRFQGNMDKVAEELNEKFPFYKILEPYPEAEAVLKYFKQRGFKIGVISDTYPSLEKSIKNMGLGIYIDSYTASSLVGVMKPDPRIYNAALDSLGVKAEESIYIDDYKPEADGARAVGFTSFYLERNCDKLNLNEWTIGNLKHLIEYTEQNK